MEAGFHHLVENKNHHPLETRIHHGVENRIHHPKLALFFFKKGQGNG